MWNNKIRRGYRSFAGKVNRSFFNAKTAVVGAGTALAAASGSAFAQVASEIGGAAQSELTAAQGIIIALLTTLVAIAIGFVVYSLIKKAK